jgi:hypothetical protein
MKELYESKAGNMSMKQKLNLYIENLVCADTNN